MYRMFDRLLRIIKNKFKVEISFDVYLFILLYLLYMKEIMKDFIKDSYSLRSRIYKYDFGY